jgi:NTE family protein
MNINVALVLSGGGARGIANIGVIEKLQKRGYQITSIAGTSLGALVGMYSAGKLEEYKNSSY